MKRRSHRVPRDRISQLVESSNCGVLSTSRSLIAFPTTATPEDSFPSDYRNIECPFVQGSVSVIANYVLNRRRTSIARYPEYSNRTFNEIRRNSADSVRRTLCIRYPARGIPFRFYCSFKFQDPRILRTAAE